MSWHQIIHRHTSVSFYVGLRSSTRSRVLDSVNLFEILISEQGLELLPYLSVLLGFCLIVEFLIALCRFF